MLEEKIQADLVVSLKARDEVKTQTLRMLLASVHNRQIELRAQKKELNDEEIIQVVVCEVKKHKESIEAFGVGNRIDLVEKEKKELAILEKYMPAQLSEEEIHAAVEAVIKEVNLSGAADFGKVMSAVMAKIRGQADGGVVSRLVREVLSG